MATSAALRVFGTTELLEQILLHLVAPRPLDEDGNPYPRDPMSRTKWHLFAIQRTCRAFKDTINSSVTLRRGLLLEPPTASKSLALEMDNELVWLKFPVDNTKKPYFFFTHDHEEKEDRDPNKVYLLRFERRFSSDIQAQASWRRLHLSKHQYLIKRIRASTEWDGSGDRAEITGHWLNPTLGEIFDKVCTCRGTGR